LDPRRLDSVRLAAEADLRERNQARREESSAEG
jgi:hypothetical protein